MHISYKRTFSLSLIKKKNTELENPTSTSNAIDLQDDVSFFHQIHTRIIYRSNIYPQLVCNSLSNVSARVTLKQRASWCAYSVITQRDLPGTVSICRQGISSASKCKRHLSKVRSWDTASHLGSCLQYHRQVWSVDWGRGNSRKICETPSVSS